MLALTGVYLGFGQTSKAVREPAVAGMFYPADPKILTQTIKSFLDDAKIEKNVEIGGIVSPHAGYVYSGPVAAWGYKQLRGKHYDVIVVLAPSHLEYFSGASIYPGTHYATPLGQIEIDSAAVRQLCQASDHFTLSEKGHHTNLGDRGEHSLEVQLPFLQQVLGKFKLVPIVMADQSWKNVEQIAKALADVFKNQNVLFVASSDLSHYHPYSEAKKLDAEVIRLFSDMNYKELISKCEDRRLEACGFGPIATVQMTCQILGFNKSKLLRYATSGDVAIGDKSKVVGYMSGMIYRDRPDNQ